MIEEKIREFIANPGSGDFNDLAREAFAFQYAALEPYRRLCERSGIEPAAINDWRQIPALPAMAFKTLELATRSGGELFRSSGTTTGQRSVHRHGFLELYRTTIDHSFPAAVLDSPPPVAMLSLIPARSLAPDSSLSFMIDHVLQKWGNTDSVDAVTERGVDARRVRSFLSARQRDRQPAVILGTALAWLQALEALERYDLRFRLPAGSSAFETGGYKGMHATTSPRELSDRIGARLGIGTTAIVREYGMTELTSQLYTAPARTASSDLYQPPHWVRLRILDPQTLREVTDGEPGLLCIFDLANLSSAVHLLTEDLGALHADGLRLLGRARGAELRGCSLTSEELQR